ncbi:hypothetical protein K7I13_09770 [Brucepastera parasyntrophica]|uniref:hypothetical protein n=1 Tax=Brucepastera parasyntrophica TaxID=2880008 RepID=UPI00210E1556|nr:hypothetical protein [Brucepastera parasyntrophica]ULQ58820.1 hypothetical protein K7I13_09770 [Brucepastera parasyntrophica]
MQKITARKRIILAVIGIMSLALVQCEIGLGDSVDTSAPELTIDYPAINSIARGDLVVSGKAWDETAVDRVEIVLQNSSGVKQWSGTAHPDSTRRWTANIPNTRAADGSVPFADGQYRVVATAVDTSNRKTSVTVPYYLDNTPPLVVISRPSTSGPVKADPYGDDLVFSGTLWDENSCAEMEVVFYQDNGGVMSEVARYSQTNVPSDWKLIIPGDKDDPTSVFGQLAAGMTGSEGARELYYTLRAVDNAQEYRGPGETVAAGNETDQVYIYDSILALLPDGEKFPSSEALASLVYGSETMVAGISEDDLTGIGLHSSEVDTSTSGKFSIDPYNKNPNVSILQWTQYVGNNFATGYTSNKIGANQYISVTIEPGPDGVAIDTSRVYVTMRRSTDADPDPDEVPSGETNRIPLKRSRVMDRRE